MNWFVEFLLAASVSAGMVFMEFEFFGPEFLFVLYCVSVGVAFGHWGV